MPAQGISMHNIREILRLHFESKLSQHQIAASLKISSGVVNKYVSLAKAASLPWPVEPQLNDKALGALLRPYKETTKQSTFVEPDYPSLHQELKKQKGITMDSFIMMDNGLIVGHWADSDIVLSESDDWSCPATADLG